MKMSRGLLFAVTIIALLLACYALGRALDRIKFFAS